MDLFNLKQIEERQAIEHLELFQVKEGLVLICSQFNDRVDEDGEEEREGSNQAMMLVTNQQIPAHTFDALPLKLFAVQPNAWG